MATWRSPRKQSKKKKSQKMKREKTEDQTGRSTIWKIGDLRKENTENEGKEIKGLT